MHLDESAFYGGRARCKECLKPQLAAYREANRHKIRERHRKAYKKIRKERPTDLSWRTEDDPLNYVYPE